VRHALDPAYNSPPNSLAGFKKVYFYRREGENIRV